MRLKFLFLFLCASFGGRVGRFKAAFGDRAKQKFRARLLEGYNKKGTDFKKARLLEGYNKKGTDFYRFNLVDVDDFVEGFSQADFAGENQDEIAANFIEWHAEFYNEFYNEFYAVDGVIFHFFYLCESFGKSMAEVQDEINQSMNDVIQFEGDLAEGTGDWYNENQDEINAALILVATFGPIYAFGPNYELTDLSTDLSNWYSEHQDEINEAMSNTVAMGGDMAMFGGQMAGLMAKEFGVAESMWPTDHDNSTCVWVVDHINIDGEKFVGQVTSHDECINLVLTECPTATIANIWGTFGRTVGWYNWPNIAYECYCQCGTDMRDLSDMMSDMSDMTDLSDLISISCLLSSVSDAAVNGTGVAVNGAGDSGCDYEDYYNDYSDYGDWDYEIKDPLEDLTPEELYLMVSAFEMQLMTGNGRPKLNSTMSGSPTITVSAILALVVGLLV